VLLIVLATLAIAWLAVVAVVLGACVSAARGDRALPGGAAEGAGFSFAARPSRPRAA
jgi:hypothetical protein